MKEEEERTAVAVGNPLCWEVIGRVHMHTSIDTSDDRIGIQCCVKSSCKEARQLLVRREKWPNDSSRAL